MLQSVFIIRSYNDIQLRNNSSIQLVAASLIASLFSISNKYVWLDEEAFCNGSVQADRPNWKAGCPCVNPWYVLRVIWRFSFVATRFCVLSLMWSVLGGISLGLFLVASFIGWYATMYMYRWYMYLKDRIIESDDERAGVGKKCGIAMVWGIAALISTPANPSYVFALLHGLEMIGCLSVITIFAYLEFDCGLCGIFADATDRQANNNPYIKMFLFSGWGALIVDLISYITLLGNKAFDDDSDTIFDTKTQMESGLI